MAQAPNDSSTLHDLALAALGRSRFEEAELLLRNALAVEKANPTLYLHLGIVLIEQGRIKEASAALDKALSLHPESPEVFNLMGRAAFMRGAPNAALTHYRHAVELKPDFSDAYNGMGNALHALGRFREAVDAYSSAIALEPTNMRTYVNLADAKNFVENDPHLLAMEALASGDCPPEQQMYLHFSLGKAYADINDYPRAFAHLMQGNASKRAQVAYNGAATEALFEQTQAVFTSALIRKKARHGDPSHLPVFVVGMPRSGTSLIEQILASHPRVHGAGELTTLEDVISAIRAPDDFVPFPDFVPRLKPPCVKQIGTRYLREMRRIASTDTTRVINKMPSNFLFLGLIHMALPNARIIHAVRDPIDTCLSCFSKLFTRGHNYTYDLAELGRYYRSYQELMAHWYRVLPPGPILDVRYEEMVADLEGVARRIVAHCGLNWNERCLAFYQTDRPVRTPSAMQVRQPIYSDAVGRWRADEALLRPLLTELRASRRSHGSTTRD
jgi:Tfp pilus assembly protein PilF